MSAFKPGDRVRDVNHAWTPGMAEYGTVTAVYNNGNVDVDWDGEGISLCPSDPITLAHVK